MAALLAAALAFAQAAAAAQKPQARVWATAENTRVVVETDAQLQYRRAEYTNPARLVVDINEASLSQQHFDGASVEAAAEYLKGLRVSRRDDKTFRLVFDLAAATAYSIGRIEPVAAYRHRLVIDIKPQTPPDPLLAILRQIEEAEAAQTPAAETAETTDKPFLVLIDPGHGGEDPGAIGKRKTLEKNIVLQISQKLAQEVNRRPNMRAALTRGNDRFIKLRRRVHITRQLDPDAFVSVHADSFSKPTARGSSVFVLSKRGASSAFARRLAENENLSDLVGGVSHTHASADPAAAEALRELSQDGKDRASRILAKLMLAWLNRRAKVSEIGKVNRLHGNRVEYAGFAVLKSPAVPSILVETAFLSNPEEERRLRDIKFQNKIAVAMANALQKYQQQYHTK